MLELSPVRRAALILATLGALSLGRAQERPAQDIGIGARVSGVLPQSSENSPDSTEATYSLSIGAPGAFTVFVTSLDFDSYVVVEETGTGSASQDHDSGDFWNPWLPCEAKQSSKWLVKVGSDDHLGGEFTLSVLAGRVEPPKRPVEWMRASIKQCELAGARAEAKGDIDKHLGFLNVATQLAASIADEDKSKSLAEEYLQLAQLHAKASHITCAQASLGAAELRHGNLARARELLETARPGVEELLSSATEPEQEQRRARLLCIVYDNLGDLNTKTAGPVSGLPFYRKVVEIAPRTAEREFHASAWQKLGSVLDALGDAQSAQGALDKAIALARETGEPDVIASAQLGRARFLGAHGSPRECRRECEDALELARSPSLRVDLLGTSASALIDLARYEEAQLAMDGIEPLCIENNLRVPDTSLLINRALIAFRTHDLQGARKQLEKALEQEEASGSTLQRVDILVDLGLVLADLDLGDEARQRYEEALEISQASGNFGKQARVLVDLARLEERQQRLPSAIAMFDRAAALAEEHKDAAASAAARSGRAFVLLDLGELSQARALAGATAKEFEALGMAEAAVDSYEAVARVGLLQADVDVVDGAVRVADRLVERPREQGLDRFASAGLRSRFAVWGEIAQDLVALRLRMAEASKQPSTEILATGWRSAARWKARVLLEAMRTRDASTSKAADHPQLNSPGITGSTDLSIGPNTAIVEFVAGLRQLYAYVVCERSIHCFELAESSSIEKDAAAFVATLSRLGASAQEITRQGTRLYERVLAPIASQFPPKDSTLVFIPCSQLAGLPFDALVRPGSIPAGAETSLADVHYLIDDFCVVTAPSVPILAELEHRSKAHRPPRFLIVGDPVYAAEESHGSDARRVKSFAGLARLKHTREEVIEIARLLMVMDHDATDAQRATLLALPSSRSGCLRTNLFELDTGTDASAALTKQDLLQYTCLHFAAHGHVDSEDPRRSGLVLSYEPKKQGLLSMEDVLALRLDGDLVVLSACETAKGPVVQGEGVISLASAFLEAGSRSVVATQWNVNDRASADVMKDFYSGYLEKGLHPALALQAAKLAMRHSREIRGEEDSGTKRAPVMVDANPYYWASFVYIGAPPQ